jgi:hypothetical protein
MFASYPRPHIVPPSARPESEDRVERRALAIWPRLDHRALHRCHGEVGRVALYISRRTKMPAKAIALLIRDR